MKSQKMWLARYASWWEWLFVDTIWSTIKLQIEWTVKIFRVNFIYVIFEKKKLRLEWYSVKKNCFLICHLCKRTRIVSSLNYTSESTKQVTMKMEIFDRNRKKARHLRGRPKIITFYDHQPPQGKTETLSRLWQGRSSVGITLLLFTTCVL